MVSVVWRDFPGQIGSGIRNTTTATLLLEVWVLWPLSTILLPATSVWHQCDVISRCGKEVSQLHTCVTEDVDN